MNHSILIVQGASIHVPPLLVSRRQALHVHKRRDQTSQTDKLRLAVPMDRDTHDTLLTALLSNIAKHGLLHKSSKQASLNTSSFPINHDLFTSLIFVVCRPTQTRTCFAKPQIPDRVTAVALKATVWCSTRTSMCSWWRPEEIVHTSLDQQPKHNSKPHGEPYGKSITLSARIAKLQRQVTDAV